MKIRCAMSPKPMIIFVVVLVGTMPLLLANLPPVVSNVTAAQRTDGSKIVDIFYDVIDAENDSLSVSLDVSDDGGSNFGIIPTPDNLSGDIGSGVIPGSAKHIAWNAGAEVDIYDADNFIFKVSAFDISIPENFVFVQGGTIDPPDGVYTWGLTVSDFYIDKYELTNAEWDAVMGNYGGGGAYPHANVNWFGAIEYCNRRSILEDLPPCYSYLDYGTNPDNWPSGWNTDNANHTNVSCDWSAFGYRLPSEQEWEYAARGGLQTNGCTYSGGNNLSLVGWYNGNSGGSAHPGGQLAANELGTYDMSGNLWEWCWNVLYSGPNRMLRGGCILDSAAQCAVSYRFSFYPAVGEFNVGFRICRSSP